MSVQASAWAWAVRGLPSHLRLTLLAVADACNADGFGYPGQARIAGLVQCSERQIRSNLAALAKLGLVDVFHRPGDGEGRKSNAYQLRLEVLDGSEATGSVLPVAILDSEATGSAAHPDTEWRRATGSAAHTVTPWQEATGSVAQGAPGGATGSAAQGNRKCSAGQPEVWRSETAVAEGGATGSLGGATGSPGLPPNVSKERQEEKEKTVCAARTAGAEVQRSVTGEPGEPPGFARFWATWPAGQRKRGRKDALTAWRALHLEDQAAAIVADVERRQVLDDFWLRGFTPMPQTYLRGARWEDELTQAPPQRSDSPTMRGILALEDLKWAPPLRPGLPA